MSTATVLIPQSINIPANASAIPADVDVLKSILDHYGFDYFFKRTLRMIDLSDPYYADAVDDALDQFTPEELNEFNLRRAFRVIVADLKAEEDYDYEECLEVLAEEDYVVPVTTALAYSVEVGESDVDYLSKLVRNRAKKLLKQHRRSQSN